MEQIINILEDSLFFVFHVFPHLANVRVKEIKHEHNYFLFGVVNGVKQFATNTRQREIKKINM
ncbi:hypothetical protein SDC9_154282 [bioreactor metagenome]|uniref:Uncharacterized protein n=1 Tax=bioreactor metagenome TaxID=1076179 RepID=A0A645F2Y8_9ZZZZ